MPTLSHLPSFPPFSPIREVFPDVFQVEAGFRFATVPEILEHFGTRPGYLGPIGLKKPVSMR